MRNTHIFYSFSFSCLGAGRSVEDRHLRKVEATGSNPVQSMKKITDESIGEFLAILKLKGVTNKHIKEVERYLRNYKKYIFPVINKSKSLEYFSLLQKQNSIAYYKRQMYQLLKFLRFLKVEWATEIKLPNNPIYSVRRLSEKDIEAALNYFGDNVQMKALVLLGANSGLRALELFQLSSIDVDLEKRAVFVRHEPENGKTTKTKRSRISFFNLDTQKVLKKYIETNPQRLFAQKTCNRKFKNAPLKVKDLRKFFSQEWDRRGGPTSIKKIIMGHSLKGDVDLMHYNCQSEEDLKKIYDMVMHN